VKENKEAALAEIGGSGYWGQKNPVSGKFEVVKYV
jgi:hypothetical protein